MRTTGRWPVLPRPATPFSNGWRRQPWRLRLAMGQLLLHGRFGQYAGSAARLMPLLSLMLVACGVLMALEAPRTLGLMVLLLTALECALLIGLFLARVLSGWRMRSRSRLMAGRQLPSMGARLPGSTIPSSVSAVGLHKDLAPVTPVLDGRVVEAALLFLILAWWLAHP